MDLNKYISEGIIESYLLGVASKEEVAEFQRMRILFPELETEIAIAEGRMERAALDEAVLPPVRVWEGIRQRLDWEHTHQEPHNPENKNYTFINMQPKEGTYISVHKTWKYVMIAVAVLWKVCLIAAVYYYFKTQSVEEKLQNLQHPQSISTSK